MQKYIGVKIVEATPMILGDYNIYRGWTIPADEYPDSLGFLVRYPDGYESWCPETQFAEANELMTGMTFGHAIEAAKYGHKIARTGWNGKNMFVVYQKGYPEGIPMNTQTANAYGYQEGDLFKCDPYLQMRTSQGTHAMWLASQADILSRDWMIV